MIVAFSSLAHADTVHLRVSARVAPDAALTLAQIADLNGAEALRFASLTLLESPLFARGELTISIDDVREALGAAGVNWGHVALTGGACAVRAKKSSQASTRSGIGPAASPEASKRTSVDTLVRMDAGTVRMRVSALLARVFDASPSDLRLRFSARDDSLLSTLLAGRRIEIQPGVTKRAGERIPVTIWMYKGDHVATRRTVLVEAQVRKRVLIMTADVQRKAPIDASIVRKEDRWISPGGPKTVESLEEIKGSVARARIASGAVLRATMLESPIVIRKGERITIHCLGESIVLKVRARALSSGRVGERIECKMEGASQIFVARVDGPGRAVIALHADASEPQTSRETP